MQILIVGAGAYGLALSNCLKGNVFVYSSIKEEIEYLNKTHKSKIFNVKLNSNIKFKNIIDFEYDLVIVALPTNVIESELKKINIKKDVPIIIASKGIIDGKFIYNIISNIYDNPIYILSGPSFACDMIKEKNILLTIAGTNNLDIFNSNVKLEYTDDLLGVEVCGVAKNIFAISCGILDGVGASDSTRAAFLNMIINECRNILSDFRCNENTIFLSCGIGDIILTCTSINSRNYKFGYMIGSNSSKKKIDKFLSTNTVEGLNALKSLKTNNELINLIYNIIYNNVKPQEILNYIVK